MEYAWLEQRQRHDPIATDTNLAEIDFEDFKNEDLAFAFSCGEEESGGSSTDMSICRSEVLFSSMRDSMDPNLAGGGGAEGVLQDSLCQDSLLVDGDFNYSEQVKVNKNNYTLTYSGHGAMGSFIASMVTSGAIGQTLDENNSAVDPQGLGSSGKLITWYNLGKQQSDRAVRSRFREENSLNNNTNAEDSRKSRSLPDIGKDRVERSMRGNRLTDDGDAEGVGEMAPTRVPATLSEVKLVNAFFKGRKTPDQEEVTSPEVQISRGKDGVQQFLRTASRLTSIEETPIEGCSSSSSGTSGTPENTLGNETLHQKFVRTASSKYPDIDFLDYDASLWDTFFMRGKMSGKFQSVLMKPQQQMQTLPPLPVEEYLQNKRRANIIDAESLRLLLPAAHKHLLTSGANSTSGIKAKEDKIEESFGGVEDIAAGNQKWSPANGVREAWAAPSTAGQLGQAPLVRRQRSSRRSSSVNSSERNLNALNNNADDVADVEDSENDYAAKRRSYHPQDFLSKVLARSSTHTKRSDFPKSGSQNDLCDSWAEEEEDSKTPTPSSGGCSLGGRGRGTVRNLSAEYPFHRNLCLPHQGINFDLTHKRGLFVALYSSVERLLAYQDYDAGAGTSAKHILLQELCPALHAIMEDGLKPEVITSFGRMQTSVWRVVEAVTRQGGPNAGTTVCDLVMLLNTKFAANGEDHRKFAGFISGLVNMSTLHVWYTKLKWSMDILLRFYERHAFICALHKETKLLFDELIYCLQRLYSINRIELPFNSDLLEDIPLLVASPKHHNPDGCFCNSGRSSSNTSRGTSTTTSAATSTTLGCSGRKSSGSLTGSKSRIPRPISLPKRLEAKLGKSPSPVRSHRGSRPPSVDLVSPTMAPTLPSPLLPTSQISTRKSRVRDTIKLFDSKAAIPIIGNPHPESGLGLGLGLPPQPTARTKTGSSQHRKSKAGSMQLKSPKTGAGESMALDTSD